MTRLVYKHKMLKLLAENKQLSNFVIIQDSNTAKAEDLFIAFLRNHDQCDLIQRIDLFCYEHPPDFYDRFGGYSKIVSHDYFSDPCGWHTNSSDDKLLNPDGQVIFIDALSLMFAKHGFNAAYKYLHQHSRDVKKVVCIVHEDVHSAELIQKLHFLSTTLLEVLEHLEEKGTCCKIVKILHKKPGGKVICQKELYSVSKHFEISEKIYESNKKRANAKTDTVNEIENLTTFKLGLELSNKEKIAKSKLVLPYLRNKEAETGRIVYEQDADDDLEEDPDDDLDI